MENNKFPIEKYPNFGMRNKNHTNESKNKISMNCHSRKNKGKGYEEIYGIKKAIKIRNKISIGNKNKNVSIKTRKKLSVANKGRTLTKEHKRKLSIAGKKRKLSDEHKRKIGIAHIGINFPMEKYPNFGMRGKKKTFEQIQTFKIARAKQIMPIKDTTIEIKIQKLLSTLHIEYFTHKYISNINYKYQCDIFIPIQYRINQKTIIECDGCYWHGCPKCNLNFINKTKQIEIDKIRTKELQENGFRIIRLWEHEIKDIKLNELLCKIC